MLQADEDDRRLTESVLAELNYPATIRFFEDVDMLPQAISEFGPPSVIMVNNKKNNPALDFIRRLRAGNQLRHIPIVVLGEITTSKYIYDYYEAGANTYVIKPATINETQKKIRLFLEYWFEVAAV